MIDKREEKEAEIERRKVKKREGEKRGRWGEKGER